MEYTPQTTYRSQSCRDMAERVATSAGLQSLNVTVNIDAILPNRNAEVINQVGIAIAKNANFVLFADKSHYIIIIPCKLAVACYVDGVRQTMEVMHDMQQFQNRIKIAFAVYDKFRSLDRSLESGRHGDGSLPFNTNREDLSNGKEGA